MDDETVKHLWALREVNKALITGLETAIFAMEKWDDPTPTRRQSMIEALKRLVIKSDMAGQADLHSISTRRYWPQGLQAGLWFHLLPEAFQGW